MSQRPHPPRPTDLIALLSYDGTMHRNQAVTRERAGHEGATPHVLGAAIDEWFGRGRHAWIDVRGRHIRGLATARELGGRDEAGHAAPGMRAWEIDTLAIGERRPEVDSARVAQALLRQAAESALSEGAGRLLLRLSADSPVIEAAIHGGFEAVMPERLWSGPVPAREATPRPGGGSADQGIRALTPADAHAEFTLYHQATPAEARQALAMTFEEWAAVLDSRWLGRHAVELGAFEGDRLRAVLRATRDGQRCLFTLDAAPDAASETVRLVGVLADLAAGAGQLLSIVPAHAGVVEHALSEEGLMPAQEYVLFCRRLARPIRQDARAKARIVAAG